MDRGGVRSVAGRIAAVAAVTALGVAGCSGGSGSSGKPGSSGGSNAAQKPGKSDSSAPTGGSLGDKVPSAFSNDTAWRTQVAWATKGIGKPTSDSDDQEVSDFTVAQQQGTLGVVRTVGGSVVIPSFASGGASGPVVTTLEFVDAKTGKPIAEKALPSGTFLGLTTDVAAGKPVVVVRYLPAQDDAAAVVVLFDASGTQVWSSESQQVAGSGTWSGGLFTDGDRGVEIVGGYMVRLNNGKDTSDHTDSSYDVVDITGKSVLHVPAYADKWDQNSVDLVQGYAVVSYDDSLAQSDTSKGQEHFTVYDLAAGGKQVGQVTEKDSGGVPQAGGVAAAQGKVLLTWLGSGGGALPPTQMTVLDTATGQTTPPAAMPGGVMAEYSTLIDPATSNVVLYDTSDSLAAGTAVISLSQGKVLWTQQDQHSSLIPLALHGGVLYGVEAGQLGGSEARLLAVKEADGSPAGGDYELSPLDFTADGAPLFAEAISDFESGASHVTVGVGHTA